MNLITTFYKMDFVDNVTYKVVWPVLVLLDAKYVIKTIFISLKMVHVFIVVYLIAKNARTHQLAKYVFKMIIISLIMAPVLFVVFPTALNVWTYKPACNVIIITAIS